MKIRLPLICILAFAIFHQSISYAQTVSVKDSDLSEQEKNEVRAFAKEFVVRLQKTNNIRPLIKPYFAENFDVFAWYYLWENANGKKALNINASERRRMTIGVFNYLSITGVMMLGFPYKKGELQIPRSLAPSYNRFLALIDHNDDDDSDRWIQVRKNRLLLMRAADELSYRFARYRKRHPLESNKIYLAEVQKREKIDDYNYSVITDSPDPNADHPAAEWIRNHKDARTYMVGTPIGLSIGVIKFNNQYKVMYVWPWPMSYDGRVGH